MTNPNNIVRVRARNGGRASVYEANAWAQGFSMGILEGYGVAQNTSADMNVLVGGSATKPDVLIAQNPAGYKIALDIIGRQAVAITAPASNSRISAIVAYTNDLSLSTTQDDVTGSPASCGLIVVNGTAAANPVAPTDSQIRTAITSDGATGSQAAYCVIATIQVASNTTMITNSLISTNQAAMNGGKSIIDASITANKIDFATFADYSLSEINTGIKWIDGKVIYKKTIDFGALPNNSLKTVPHNISNLGYILKIEGIAKRSTDGIFFQIGNAPNPDSQSYSVSIHVSVDSANVSITTGMDRRDMAAYVTLYYTKTV